MSSPRHDPAELIKGGFAHLHGERPLAAWANWQRALRFDPDSRAARGALDRLAGSVELPSSALTVRRFLTPTDPEARARWDRAFQGRDLAELDDAAEVFADLVRAAPDDADAVENRALCLAWLGRNAQAVESLDRLVSLTAATDFDRAVRAWTLAEILRPGASDGDIADEFRHSVDLSGLADPRDIRNRLARQFVLREVPLPTEGVPDPRFHDVVIEEWLDRPIPEPGVGTLGLADLPRVVAILYSNRSVLRFTVPDVSAVEGLIEGLNLCGIESVDLRRVPMPLATLDAAVWTIRFPDWADGPTRHRLYRENVEDYYENRWVRRPRRGLGDRTPIEAGRLANAGDIAIRAKLEATIGLLEELARRPATTELHQGYPFDRLRKRVGLVPRVAESVEAIDPACMSGPDLDALDPTELDDNALAEAFRSAAALGEDTRTAGFAIALVDRKTATLARLDLPEVFAPLVRLAISDDRPDDALALVDRAITIDSTLGGRRRPLFTTWRGEILARFDQPDEAARVYRAMILEGTEAPARIALDGATTLLDLGHLVQACELAREALKHAQRDGDHPTIRAAEAILAQVDLE